MSALHRSKARLSNSFRWNLATIFYLVLFCLSLATASKAPTGAPTSKPSPAPTPSPNPTEAPTPTVSEDN